MAYGIFCTIFGAEMAFSAPCWWLKVIGALASVAGLLMMAGEEKVAKKSQITSLELGKVIKNYQVTLVQLVKGLHEERRKERESD